MRGNFRYLIENIIIASKDSFRRNTILLIRNHSMLLLIRGLLVGLFLTHGVLANTSNDEHFTIVEKNHKKGLFDEDGNVIIPVAYDDLGWSQGLPEVFHKVIGYRENKLWGLIGIKNKIISEPRYTEVIPFVDKLLIASITSSEKSDIRYGLINTDGEQELSFRYCSLIRHHHQLIASIIRNNRPTYGLLNREGEAILGFDFNSIVPLSEELYGMTNERGQVALFSRDGTALTGFEYDSISTFQHQLAIIYQQGMQGVIQEDGTEVVKPQYRQVKIHGPHAVSVLSFNKWHVYNAENQWVVDYTFDSILPVGEDLYRVKMGSLETFVDRRGESIVPRQWRVESLQEGFAVLSQDKKLGVMRSRGGEEDVHQLILPLEYDSVRIDGQFVLAAKQISETSTDEYVWSLFDAQGKHLTSFAYQSMVPKSEGRFLVQRKNLWGYLDTTGTEVVACQYLRATSFSGGVASVDLTNGQGVIDRQGNWKIEPFNYREGRLNLERVHDDLYIFKTDFELNKATKYGLINSEGKEIYSSHNELVHNGHSLWERNAVGKYGLVSYQGVSMLDIVYDSISPLQEQKIYLFHKEGKSGIIDRQGNILVDLNNDFQELHTMSNEFLGVKINDKFGFVDSQGRLRIANRYDSITHFRDNMAAVKLLGKWGYINKSERLIVQPHFEQAYMFHKNLAVVKKNNRYGMVNRKGQTVIPIEYPRIEPAQQNRFLLYKGDQTGGDQDLKVGLAGNSGKILIYPKYDDLQDLGNGYVIARRGDRYGLLSLNGRSTIPLKHQQLIYDQYNDVYLALEKPAWQTLDLPLSVGK